MHWGKNRNKQHPTPGLDDHSSDMLFIVLWSGIGCGMQMNCACVYGKKMDDRASLCLESPDVLASTLLTIYPVFLKKFHCYSLAPDGSNMVNTIQCLFPVKGSVAFSRVINSSQKASE